MALTDEIYEKMFDNNLNVEECDGKKCRRCGKIPPTRKVERMIKDDKTGISHLVIFTDRSARVDCDRGTTEQHMDTFCKDCWKKEIQK